MAFRKRRRQIKPTRCPSPSGYFVSGKIKIPAPCNNWECPVCGPHKKNLLIDRVRDAAAVVTRSDLPKDRKIFRKAELTLQIDDPEDIMECWARARTFLADHGIKSEFYFLVKEFTRRGKRHLHVLINCYIPQGVLKAAWIAATFGRSSIVYITRTDLKNGAAYMTKYLTKAITAGMFRRKEHRYSTSRRYFDDPSIKNAFDRAGKKWKYEYDPHWRENVTSLSDIWIYRNAGRFFERMEQPVLTVLDTKGCVTSYGMVSISPGTTMKRDIYLSA